MDSEVANRVFQGRENPAIASVRGRLRPKIEDAGGALRFFPAARSRSSLAIASSSQRSIRTWRLTRNHELISPSRTLTCPCAEAYSLSVEQSLGRKRIRGPQVPRRLGSATGLREALGCRWPTTRADSPQATGPGPRRRFWRSPSTSANQIGSMNSSDSMTRTTGSRRARQARSPACLPRRSPMGVRGDRSDPGRELDPASAAQARVVARMRERGYSLRP